MMQIQRSKHIFQICIDRIVHNDIFLKVIFYYALTCSVECFIFTFAGLKCYCVFLTLMFTSKYYIIHREIGALEPRRAWLPQLFDY